MWLTKICEKCIYVMVAEYLKFDNKLYYPKLHYGTGMMNFTGNKIIINYPRHKKMFSCQLK